MKRFQRYPKFADRKILRSTGFFNLIKSSAQSSEYLFKKLKIVILVFFIDNAVLQLITAKGPKPTYQITADSRLRNLQFSTSIFIFYRSYDRGTWIIWLRSRPKAGGVGGGGVLSRPLDKGVPGLPKSFFQPFGPHFGPKRGRGAQAPRAWDYEIMR